MQPERSNDAYTFLKGGGEMGHLTRSHDWAKTSLGTPDTWPQSLRTALNLVLHSASPTFLFWGEQLFSFYNDAFRSSVGDEVVRPDTLGRPGGDVWADAWPIIHPLISRVLTQEEAVWQQDQPFSFHHNGRANAVYWTFSCSPVYDESGKPAGVFGTCFETTEKVKTLAQLAESRNQLHFATEAAQLSTWDYNPLTNRLDGNARLKEWFGLPAHTDSDLSQAMRAIAVKDQPLVAEAIKQTMLYQSGGQLDISYTIIHPLTRQERIVRSQGRVWFNDDKKAYRFNGTLTDISQQKKVADEQQRQLAVMQASHEFVSMASIDTSIQYANPAAMTMLGWDTTAGKMIRDFIYPEDWPAAEKLLTDLPGKGYFAQEIRFVNSQTGLPFWLDWNAVAIKDPASGEVTGLAIVSPNITERKNSEKNLRESERRFRSLIEEAPVATCLFVGRELRVEVANAKMLDHWGKNADVIGSRLSDILPELSGQPFLQILDNVFTSGQPYSEIAAAALLEIDGVLGTYYFDFTYKPLRDAEGRVYAIMAMSVNVTEQVSARNALMASEARYRQLSAELELQVQERTWELETSNEELAASNEEMASTNEALAEANQLFTQSNKSLEQFAYIASHDLQEPLRKIQSFGNLLQDQYSEKLGDGVDMLNRMQQAATRMSVLIRDLLTFSRMSNRKDSIGLIFLRDVLKGVLNDLDLVISETNAQIIIEQMPKLQGDSSQLGQLFLNLLTNAIKFRREDIPPVISISNQVVSAQELPDSLKPNQWSESYYRIDVSDNGIGFDPKYAERIFQVFQRLHGKQQYPGTGIGLAICEKVVANHGGAIMAVSKPGEGSTFRVFLPV